MILWLTTFTNSTAAVSRQEKEDSEPMTLLNPARLASLIKAEKALFSPDSVVGPMTLITDNHMANQTLTSDILAGK